MAKNIQNDDDEPTMAQVMDRLARIQEASNQVHRQQLKQTAPKSNTQGPGISVFNPRGQKDFPMPRLKCEVLMPFSQKPEGHGLDREEVELLNLVEPGIYNVELNDDSTIKVCVIGRKNRATDQLDLLTFSGPIDPDTGHPTPLWTASNKQQFPPLRVLLRQIVGEAADAVLPIATERKKVAQFLAATTPEQQQAALLAGALPVSLGE